MDKQKRRRTWKTSIPPGLLHSQAFRECKPQAVKVFLHFLFKVNWVQVKQPKSNKKIWRQDFGQELVFTYSQAEELGFSRQQFSRALKELVAKGFIDRVHAGNAYQQGGGHTKDYSLYAISERWRDYGTANFKEQHIPKDTRKRGFAQTWEEDREGLRNNIKAKNPNAANWASRDSD
ncbi:MAG: MarR family transcriptional regulator [Desulfarculus sp.]|nr:MarR family transcriptional regulator [Pseudomonadota bacterium]MBU4596366.1 MarR family transcriptional regulator [Pseudomonadota bacterium]MBV1717078.1 MarR family transcriptional regulator [Desulfarculus sp.]MBV1737725.1 MarR family transcriptional regulator [Desulfarculus sp.]